MKLNDIIKEVMESNESDPGFSKMNESVLYNKGQDWAVAVVKANRNRVGKPTVDEKGEEMNGMSCLTKDGAWHYYPKTNVLSHISQFSKSEALITLSDELKSSLKKFVL